jgi:hypothetical protein
MVTKEQAFEIFGPHLADLNATVLSAFSRYEAGASSLIPAFNPTTKANVLSCLIKEEQRKAFGGRKQVAVIENAGTFFLEFDGGLLLWTKKLNRSLLSSNNETAQSNLLKANSGLLPDFLPGQHMIILGYRVDMFWSSVQDVYLTCPDGSKSNFWTSRIDAVESHQQLVFDLPVQDDVAEVAVRIKADAVAVRRKAAGNE